MFERFTERARKVMSLSRQAAQDENSEFIGTEHILIGLINEGGGVACKVLKNLCVDPSKVTEAVKKLMTPSPPITHTLGQIPFSPRSKRVIELAGEAASQLGHEVVGTEHLLLGILKENEGLAAQALINLGFKLDTVRDAILECLGADVVIDGAAVRVVEEKKVKCSSCRKESSDKDAQMNAMGRELVCEDCYMSLTSFERLFLKMLGQIVKQQGRKY